MARRLDGGRRLLRPDARVDRADPPPGEVRRATRGRSTSGSRRPRDAAREPAGPCRSSTRSASSRPASGCARVASRRPTADAAAAGWGGDRLAVINGPDGAWARRHADGLGHDRRRGRVRDRRPRPRSGKAAGDRPGPAGRRAGRSAGCVIGSRRRGRDRRGRRASSAWPRRPGPTGAYIDSGAEIPSRPSAFASVIWAARASARRAAERSGSAGSTTRASR